MVWGVIALVVYDLFWEFVEYREHLRPAYQERILKQRAPDLDDQTKALIGRFAVHLSLFTGTLPHFIAIYFLLNINV